MLGRFYFFYSSIKTYKNGQFVSFKSQILSDPKSFGVYQSFSVSLDKATKVTVETSADDHYYYGDSVKITGTLKKILLSGSRYIFTMNSPRIEADSRENSPILTPIYNIRQKIIEYFSNNLDQDSSSLLLGIVFGIKYNLPKTFSQNIQITGVTHVIAASGMNVTMVAGFLFYLFAFVFKRQWAITLSIFGILFYTVLSGFEPSIIRAAIMGSIAFGSQILGKQQYGLGTLILTAFAMLFYNPSFIVDVGFQLSFVATIGLLYIPSLFKRFKNDITELFITTISAQIATIPILISNFGNYSIFSVITNGLVLWTIPILMILGSFAAILSFIFQPAAKLILLLCLPFLDYFEKVVNFFGSFGSSFSFSQIPLSFVVGYYLILVSILVFKYTKKI